MGELQQCYTTLPGRYRKAGASFRIAGCVVLSLFILPCADFALAGSANIFTGSNANTIITQALVNSGTGSDIVIHINQIRDEDELASTSDTISAEVGDLKIDKEHNNWKATLFFKAGSKNLAPVALSGNYDEMVQVPVLKHQIRPGDTITTEDIEFNKQPLKHLRKNTVTETKDLVGKSPKHVISQNRPIRQDEIANPAILMKGTHVTMVYKAHNLEIRTLGEALESGAKGDVIRVKNLTSKSIVTGIVETSDHVRVSSPDSDSAEAM